MKSEVAVLSILANSVVYNAHVGGSYANARIYYDEIAQAKPFPQAMVTVSNLETTDTKDNSDFDIETIQIFHSAETKAKSLQMASDARSILQTSKGIFNGVNISEIRMIDRDGFTEKIVDKKIYTEEQLYRIIEHL